MQDMIDKTKLNQIGVYVIGAHRLALCTQLLEDFITLAIDAGLNFNILYIGSARYSGDGIYKEFKQITKDTHRVINTTRGDEVKEAYISSKEENRHLIVVSTYDSFRKLSNIDSIDICTFDEAHTTIDEDFSDNINEVKPLIKKEFYFTATRKIMGDDRGMNDKDFYGEILDSSKPREMIDAGEIVPPRLHDVIIDDNNDIQLNGDNHTMLFKSVKESFLTHKKYVKKYSSNPDMIGAKLLISASGTDELFALHDNPEFMNWCKKTKINVFVFSSAKGEYSNFENFPRQIVMNKMNELKLDEDAILLHIDILTEGIDLPAVTGVMPLRQLNEVKLLQTLGRAARLIKNDRTRLYSGEILPIEKEKFIKPFCWFVVPRYYSTINDAEKMKDIIKKVRDTYEMPYEEFVHNDVFESHLDQDLERQTAKDVVEHNNEYSLSHIIEDLTHNEFLEQLDSCNKETLIEEITKMGNVA